MCSSYFTPITHVINYCLQHSIFPSQWKRALVIPLPKTNNPTSMNNLRPISILPTFSKILEKVINNQLQIYLKNNNIIPITQSGFKAEHSCTTALLHITDDIFRALDQGKLTILTLLDYSKAFDTLNHELLNAILNYIGISKNALSLFGSYLNNRSQAVTLNGNTSTYIQINKGIPQGSILGPIFFNIYSLQNLNLSCLQHYYADDAQIYLSFPPDESKQAVAALNFDLNQIFTLLVKHCLQINASKSALIIFGKKADRIKFVYDNHCIMLNAYPNLTMTKFHYISLMF
jgi:hypothetical protein